MECNEFVSQPHLLPSHSQHGNNWLRVWWCELDHRTSLSFSLGADGHRCRRIRPLSVVPFGFVSLFFDWYQFVSRLPPLAGGPTFIEAGGSFIMVAHPHSFHSKLSRFSYVLLGSAFFHHPQISFRTQLTFYPLEISFILLHQPKILCAFEFYHSLLFSLVFFHPSFSLTSPQFPSFYLFYFLCI